MKNPQALLASYTRPITIRLPRTVWLLVEQCRETFSSRDSVTYSFGEVLRFLLETHLYEHQLINSEPALDGRGARSFSRKQLEEENAVLRQQLAEILNRKSQENL